MRQENDRARQQFSNPTFGYNGSSGSSAGPCVSTFSYTDTRGCSASVNGCDGTCALGRVETIASFAPVTGEVIDLKECFSGFGVNWGTGVDCGALFIPFLSSKADDIVEAGVDSRRAISNCFASFSGDTEVLMADGTTKPIAEIEVGEFVWAVDPETGESGPRMVVGTWPHKDTLLEFTVDGGSVTTTEDHHFWNETDNDWQETKHIDEGDYLLNADGDVIEAGNLDWSTAHYADAYDLTIDQIHTYFVQVGEQEVLVHNSNHCNGVYAGSDKHHQFSGPGRGRGPVGKAPTNGQAALDISIQVKPTSPRRVAHEPTANEFVVLDETLEGEFHGHVVPWSELHQDMQNALIKAGVVTRKGKAR